MRASMAWPRTEGSFCGSGSRGDAQPFDEVEAGDHLGDRVLDLQARVHLHEVETAVLLGDELHRAGPRVRDRLRRGHGGGADLLLARRSSAPGLLDDLLVPALHRAVALEKMHDVAVRIAEDLHLDMARALQIALDQHPVVAERGLCLALGRLQRGGEGRLVATFIPLPPPPAEGLISTGNPMRAASFSRTASSCRSPW